MLRKNKLAYIVIFWVVMSVAVFLFIIFSDDTHPSSSSSTPKRDKINSYVTKNEDGDRGQSLEKELAVVKMNLSKALDILRRSAELIESVDADMKK